MTLNDDVKELKKEIENSKKEYPIKLSWKQLWIVITTMITIIGSSFGVGIKIQSETGKLSEIKLSQQYEQKLANKDMVIIDVQKKMKDIEYDNKRLIYKNKFLKKRLNETVNELLKLKKENSLLPNDFSLKLEENENFEDEEIKDDK